MAGIGSTTFANDDYSAHTVGMASASGKPRPRLANSPFAAQVEPVIEDFALADRVCHDAYGMGRVVSVDNSGLTVDFGSATVRVESPYRKMTKI